MSISNSLNNALSGLTAASRAAEVVSSNVANAMTDGYGRRQLDLSAHQIGGRGAGVRIDGVARLVDRAILADRRIAESAMARDGRLAASLQRLEAQLGGTGSAPGIQDRIVAFEQALVTAAADPGSDVRLGVVRDRLTEMVAALNRSSADVQAMRQEADADIAAQVEMLNTSLRQVEALNADVFRARQTGNDPSGLMDQRQVIIDRIAGIVPIRELQRSGDRVALMTTSGQVLLDGPAAEIGFVPRATITADMTFTSGGLGGLTVNGDPVSRGPVGKLSGGSLGAAFTLRDETLVSAQAGLDRIAADLIGRFENPATDPTLPGGVPGLLTDAGAMLDPVDIDGLAGRIAVNALVDPNLGGDLWRLRDGVAAAAPGPAGQSAQLIRWKDGLAALSPDASGTLRSAAGHAALFAADIGRLRVAAEDGLSFSTARWETIRETELGQGVDTDFEMQMLLRIEEAYAANARVIETVNILIRTLMEL